VEQRLQAVDIFLKERLAVELQQPAYGLLF
jgi:hypothetical protein